MGMKKQELIDGCFAKAADDEPLFVLRASDKLAPALVREWARQFFLMNTALGSETSYRKYREVLELADAMEAWPHRKMPD